MAEKSIFTGKLRVIVPAIVLGIGAIIGLRFGIGYWLYSMKHVVTDDARVKGRMVSVAPEVSGVVRVLRAEEGQAVKAGDVLLELKDSSYRLQYEEAEAQSEMIERQLQEGDRVLELQVKRAGSQIAHAEAELAAQQSALAEGRTALLLEKEQMANEVAGAESTLKQVGSVMKERQGQVRVAMSNWKRAQALFNDGIISVESRDKTQEELAQAQARLAAAEEQVVEERASRDNVLASQKRLQLLERKVQTMEAEVAKARAKLRLAETERDEGRVLEEKKRILQARLRESRAKAERANNALGDTILRSPINGVISRQRVEEGQLVQRGQPVLVISDPNDVWVLANIKETYVSEVRLGQEVDIRVDAYPDRRFTGKVDTVGAAAVSEFSLFPPTGTFTKVEQRLPVTIKVENADGLLKPGMMVVVGIVKDEER